MPDADVIARGTIFRSPYLYASHPHAALASDGDVVVVFNQTGLPPEKWSSLRYGF